MQSTISLLPVLELEPFTYKQKKRPIPTSNFCTTPDEWATYNQQCYQDAGLFNLTPIAPSSWLFAIEKLSIDHLKIILQTVYSEAAKNHTSIEEIFTNPIEYAPLWSGGYMLTINETIQSKPGCCCGLETITEWQEVTNTSQGREIWTGHDKEGIVHAERIDNQMRLAVDGVVFNIKLEDYKVAIHKMDQIIKEFIYKNGLLLNELFNIENGLELSKAMIYKWN